MAVSIISCPSCKSMVLSDTIQCPTCQHVLKPDRVDDAPADKPTEHRQQRPSPKEEECPECGEMVRVGLVRCWNCGTFMRKDIAESYRKMQQSPAPPILSDPRDVKLLDDEETSGSAASSGAGTVEEDDFELDPEVAAQASDDDFQLEKTPPASRKTSADDPSASSDSQATKTDEPSEATSETSSGSDTAEQKAPEESDQADAPHSEATGGDILWKVAMQEEAETKKRRAGGGRRGRVQLTTRGGFLVYCPNGHRIEVQERHRGQSGRCPRCKALFIVPEAPWDEEAEKAKKAAEQTAAATKKKPAPDKPAYQYNRWLTDVPVHAVDPQKLKLKPGSLANAYELMDVGFSRQGMLLVVLAKKSGLFGSVDQKKLQEAREAMLAHLQEGQPLDELPVAEKAVFDAVDVRHIRVVQPVRYEFESMFAGVPVFGEGRIAVHLPKSETAVHPQFASFLLSEFREFARTLENLYDVKGLGEECDVPLTDSYTELKCHYSENTLRALEGVEFYQADPNYELKLIGRRCQSCKLVVSEEARRKEKIGGPSGKGIAKAKCPKCQGKFGDIPLYAIEKGPEPPRSSSDEQDAQEPTSEPSSE